MDNSKKIFELAKKYENDTAKYLSQIVKIPSLSCEEEEVVKKLSELCKSVGFDEVRTDGLGSLIARIGNGPRVLAIDAHIDTVDTGDRSQWEKDPYSGDIENGMVHGRGTVDQKGGAAAMIAAGRILKELNYNGDFSIYFTFTVMEEDCDGLCWNYLIEKENLKPELAIITEPTNLSLYRGHRGRMEIEVDFQGLSAHGSAPERGENAIYKASTAALAIEKLGADLANDDFLGKGTVAVTWIKSQSPSLCAIPDQCKIHLDRRLTWGENEESSVQEVENAIKNIGKVSVPIYDRKGYKNTAFSQKKYFPTWKIEEDHSLVQAGKRTYEKLFSKKPEIAKWVFSTNAVAICGKHKIPCLGFGPGNEIYAHAPNEATPIEHLVHASAFYALLPYELA